MTGPADRSAWTAFLRFSVVGALAYLLDTAILYLLRDALGLFLGRCVSLAAAMLFTWSINRRYTFARRPLIRSAPAEALVYAVLMSIGALINLGVFVVASELIAVVRAIPALGVALGSVAGLGFNFLAARRLLESKQRA